MGNRKRRGNKALHAKKEAEALRRGELSCIKSQSGTMMRAFGGEVSAKKKEAYNGKNEGPSSAWEVSQPRN